MHQIFFTPYDFRPTIFLTLYEPQITREAVIYTLKRRKKKRQEINVTKNLQPETPKFFSPLMVLERL